jgi:AP endonuclease-2
VFDPIEAKESWSKLLGKRVVPRCEHNEPCISLTTKKPGVNCGTLYGGSRFQRVCGGVTVAQPHGCNVGCRCKVKL